VEDGKAQYTKPDLTRFYSSPTTKPGMSKTVIVDDTDPSISYTGNWQLLGAISDTDHEFNNTIHRGDANDQSLSYSFYGTSITVYGPLDSPASKGLAGVTFQVDNTSPSNINSTGTLTGNLGSLTSHVVLYTSPNLVDNADGSPHKLTISVTSASSNGPYFYFDFFTVATAKDSVAENVILDDRDDSISYVPTWNKPGTSLELLSTTSQSPGTGSTATFSFTGEQPYFFLNFDTLLLELFTPISYNASLTCPLLLLHRHRRISTERPTTPDSPLKAR
jgi:hypothetical protein